MAKKAKAALYRASPKVSDAVAKVFVDILRSGGPDVDRLCRALKDTNRALVGGRAFNRMFRAFMKLTKRDDRPLVQAGMQAAVLHGVSQAYHKRKEEAKAAGASTSLVWRLVSVATRNWVIVVLGFPALIGGIAIVTEPSARLVTGMALLLTTGRRDRRLQTPLSLSPIQVIMAGQWR